MVYHGTPKDKAEKIICEKCFNESKGDRHWLGDGVYFYRDLFYAVRWIRCLDKNRTSNLFENYSILAVELNVDKERIFSFFNPEHKLLFYSVLEACNEKMKSLNLKNEIVDGVILNIMFKKMKYGNDYDMIEAAFVHEDKKMGNFNSRLCYFPEIQFCVKNDEIIEKIHRLEIDLEDISEQIPIIDDFSTNISGVLMSKNMNYAMKKKNKRYKS